MKPLILTGWLIPDFTKSDYADLAVWFFFRFVWGALPSPHELETYFGARMPDQAPGSHWSGFFRRMGAEQKQESQKSGVGRVLPAIRDRRTMVRHGPERSIATGLAARLFSISSGDRGQVEVASC